MGDRQVKEINICNIRKCFIPLTPATLSLTKFIGGGGQVTPINLQYMGDGSYSVKDGRHRLAAYKLLGYTKIFAKVSSTPINIPVKVQI